MGISVKLKCHTRAWAYLYFVNRPTFRDITRIISPKNSEVILVVGSVCNLEQPADRGNLAKPRVTSFVFLQI